MDEISNFLGERQRVGRRAGTSGHESVIVEARVHYGFILALQSFLYLCRCLKIFTIQRGKKNPFSLKGWKGQTPLFSPCAAEGQRSKKQNFHLYPFVLREKKSSSSDYFPIKSYDTFFLCFSFFVAILFFFRSIPVARGGSQARGLI